MAAEKRVVFRSRWLPYVLVAPQIAITLVFFYWPAIQALYQSVHLQDAFGARTEFVGLDNFRAAAAPTRTTWPRSGRPRVFSVLVAVIGLSLSLLLAVMADRVLRGAGVYRTLLIWPYAVAPAIAGVLWLFLFNPSIGIVRLRAAADRHPLEPAAQRRPGDDAGRHGRGLEADQLQLPVLRRRAAVDPEVAHRGGGHRRRRPGAAVLDDRVPAARRRPPSSCWSSTSSTRSSTPSASSTPPPAGGPGRRPTILVYKVYNDGFKASTWAARPRSR